MSDDSLPPTPRLDGVVAVVTGSSRGVGRGIALALGARGATVFVTGRTSHEGTHDAGLPGTVQQTANEVTERGGVGIAVTCDHTDPAANETLLARLREHEGRLDVLVNNAWSGYDRSREVDFDRPFWEQPMWRYDLCALSLRAQYNVTQTLVPLMLARKTGLIVNVGFTDGDTYLGQVAYDVAKHGSDRMSKGFAADLRRTAVTSLALHPGFVRTERVERAAAAIGEGPAAVLHSPEYVGRAVTHLACDPQVHRFNGQSVKTGDLAVEYGFTDIDGRQPPAFRLEGRMSLATRMNRLNKIGDHP